LADAEQVALLKKSVAEWDAWRDKYRTTIIDLNGANFSGAYVGSTSFDDLDLSDAHNLDTLIHSGPSTVGVDTILKSQGKIPPEFLRACGCPPELQGILLGDNSSKTDAFYELLGKGGPALQLQKCFISYSTQDKPFVDRLQKP
jgi:hypothetical protein